VATATVGTPLRSTRWRAAEPAAASANSASGTSSPLAPTALPNH
jgi:hypothetical protein